MDNLSVPQRYARRVQTFDDLFDDPKIPKPVGLVFSPQAQRFLSIQVASTGSEAAFTAITSSQERDQSRSGRLAAIANPINTAFDNRNNRLLIVQNAQIFEVQITLDGRLLPGATKLLTSRALGIGNAQGTAIDPQTGDLLILDSGKRQVVRLRSGINRNFDRTEITRVDLQNVGPGQLRGIAVDPTNGHLQIFSPTEKKLYEFNQAGQAVAVRDLSGFGLLDPASLTFAPSGDQTDHPEQLSLYIADSDPNSSGIIEVSFVQAASITATTSATLVQTINTSAFSPASPDPAGITYANTSNTLWISDSEVNEMSIFVGKNIFQTSLTGSLTGTATSTAFSNEPTGISFNSNNGHFFISDDDSDQIYEVDSQFQLIKKFGTRTFNSFDAEDVTFASDLGTLFIVDGANSEVYQVTTSGALINNFDTASLGITDPEGIVYNPNSGNLFILGNPINILAEVTISGSLVRTFDLSAASLVKPAGLTLAPSSQNANETNIYIVDRGIDNNENPNENDGKIFEFSLGLAPLDNQAPIVNAGADQTLTVLSTFLDGTLGDDGLPNPPGSLSSTWSLVSGPTGGTVSFNDPNAEDTTVTFSKYGTYVLQLEASDGSLSASDQVQITIPDPNRSTFIYISTSGDGNVGGISFADEDILRFDVNTNTWSLFFDGSDVGLGVKDLDVRGFYINADGSLLLSFNQEATLPDIGLVDDSDIVRFVPTSLGSSTAGSYELYFDGSDVDLAATSEDIDALGFTPDGQLVVSTKGGFTVGNFSGADEDLIVFSATSLGANTSGTWSLYFDGSDVGLSDGSGENVNGAWIDQNGEIYLSTAGAFNVLGVSGDGADIFKFAPSSIGSNTSGTYSPYWDGSNNGLAGHVIDGFFIQ